VVIGGTGLIGSKAVMNFFQTSTRNLLSYEAAAGVGHHGAVCTVAVESPLNGIVEIGGPEQFSFDELIRKALSARNDPRKVIADPHAPYFGTELSERSLVPDEGARLGKIRFDEWLTSSANPANNQSKPATA
jgi:uncharacterized protein YbjT (DUF2867 family)